jgi:predicted Zn-dependent protease
MRPVISPSDAVGCGTGETTLIPALVGLRARLLLLLVVFALACGPETGSLDGIRALQEEGRHEEVIEPLQALLAEQPDDPELNYRLGIALYVAGRQMECVWPLQKAERSESFGRGASAVLAAVHLAGGNRDSALEAAQRALAHDPDDLTVLILVAEAALEARRPEVALEASDRMIEIAPENPRGLASRFKALVLLGRNDEAAAALARLEAEGIGSDPAIAAGACVATAEFLVKVRDEPEAGRARLDECVAGYRDQPGFVAAALPIYDAAGSSEAGTELLRAHVSAHPGESDARGLLARRLAWIGEEAQAEEILLQGAETSSSPGLWTLLADLRRGAGNPEGALAALDEALRRAVEREAIEFKRLDVLAELGRLEEVERGIERLSEPLYQDLLRGRVALERGDPARALVFFERALEQWPNHARARLLAARAAHELGDEQSVMVHLREATRADASGNDAALLLARLHLLRGEYEDAIGLSGQHIEERDVTSLEAHVIAARAALALGRIEGAERALAKLEAYPEHAVALAAERVALAAATEDLAAAERAALAPGIPLSDPKAEPILRALLRAALKQGEPQRARRQLDDALAEQPGEARLLALRGDLRLELGDLAGAAEDLEASRSADPMHAGAYAGLGRLSLRRGDPAAAGDLFARAAALDPSDPDIAYGAAQASLAAGDEDTAMEKLRALLLEHPEHGPAANDLAWLLARAETDLDLAFELATRAQRAAPVPEVLDTLGYVQLRRGELDSALVSLEEAIARKPGYGSARFHLALVQLERGDRSEAREALEAALAGPPFPEAAAARIALAQLGPAGSE